MSARCKWGQNGSIPFGKKEGGHVCLHLHRGTLVEFNDIRGTQNTIEFLRNSLLIWGTPKHQGIPMGILDICIPQGVGKGFCRPR